MQAVAPLSGVIVALDDLPDPVFARGLVGDGVAIDPTSNEVLSPIDGRITQLHRAHHALAITSDDGIEILIHVGLDTVKLEGRGFTPLVALDDRVTRGQPLLRFDADHIALQGFSLLTPVIVTSGATTLEHSPGLVEAANTPLMQLQPGPAAAPASEATGAVIVSEPLPIRSTGGLHARPAALLAACARRFDANIRLRHGDAVANAKSVVALMGLSTRAGDAVRVEASGKDAAAAMAAVSTLLAKSGDEGAPGSTSHAPAATPATLATPGELAGVAASPGIAIGPVHQYRRAIPRFDEAGAGIDAERSRLSDALRIADSQLAALEHGISDTSQARLVAMQRVLIDDPELSSRSGALLAQGKSAAFAWRAAIETHAKALDMLDSPLLRERAADVRELGHRVLLLLTDEPGMEAVLGSPPSGAVIIAEELSPAELAALEPRRPSGLCTTSGSSTSHVAIFARGLGLPAICGIDAAALALPEGRPVILDGHRGRLQVNPDEAAVNRAREHMARDVTQRESQRAAGKALAHTRDGHRIEVVANIRNLDDARAAIEAGAEGVGLLRTEYLFDRTTPPGEDEQFQSYDAIARALGPGRRCVIRTLDAGGDKPLPYLPLPDEANPFLGLRGIRVSLERPELFRTQLRALLRAAASGNVEVMFPMVASLEEVRAARALLDEERRSLPAARLPIGVMIEVPAAALLAAELAREVDFFSIGTNDLTQYTLAMDRGHPLLARQADALSPAVLRMIDMTITGARRYGRRVGVCGGLASDPLAAPLLAGLGIDELSADVRAIAPVKAALARFTLAECQHIARRALTLTSATDVRNLLSERAPLSAEQAP
jgi:phosphoenolpyruvate-protein phosphotransferase